MDNTQAINKIAESLRMMQAWKDKAEQALETLAGAGIPAKARKGKNDEKVIVDVLAKRRSLISKKRQHAKN